MSIPVPPIPRFPPSEHTLSDVKGLRAAGVRAGIKASGNPDVGLLVADAPMACAGVFTQNHFAAAPVLLSKAHLKQSGGLVRAVVVNSGNANACTGAQGEQDAAQTAAQVANAVGCPLEQVLVCSTGVIGHKLPMDRLRSGVDAALAALSSEPAAGRRFLEAIMTTDAYPKESSARAGDGRVAGVCKGAGMIAPDMATMLAFVAMDLDVSPQQLAAAVAPIAQSSFNAVHVDSHTSTNDTFLLFSTRARKSNDDWRGPVEQVAQRLAWLIARDGEGATKVTTIQVRGAQSDAAAKAIARHVAASALVRTALFGNDPNWGRFVSQVGNCHEVKDARSLICTLQGIEVFRAGEPTPFDAAAASKAMAVEDVRLELTLGDGDGAAVLMTADLGYRYVQVNAEYTT
jgi:glutamate N-acetyltransferase/amino-acid N-acetyltransferase